MGRLRSLYSEVLTIPILGFCARTTLQLYRSATGAHARNVSAKIDALTHGLAFMRSDFLRMERLLEELIELERNNSSNDG